MNSLKVRNPRNIMSRMINSDQRSPSISTEAFSGQPDRRLALDFDIFFTVNHLHIASDMCIISCTTGLFNHKITKECLVQMQMNPYLFFDGQCEEAFKFYAKLLGG